MFRRRKFVLERVRTLRKRKAIEVITDNHSETEYVNKAIALIRKAKECSVSHIIDSEDAFPLGYLTITHDETVKVAIDYSKNQFKIYTFK